MNKRLFVLSIFIYFFSSIVFAKGIADPDYTNGKDLLKSFENTAALEEFIQVMQNKNESMDYGILLARNTMKNQAEFQNKFDELIELIRSEPNNNIKRLAIISEMESLEAAIDPVLQEFLNKIKVSSMYVIHRIKFNDIMDEGIALIKDKKYIDASKTFIKGFSIYDGNIISAKGDEQVNNTVREQIDIIKADVKIYEAAYSRFISNFNKYESKAGSSSVSTVEKELNELQNSTLELRNVINSIIKAGSILKRTYLNEVRLHTDLDESLLPFAYRLTVGRDSAQSYEGVEGAMEAGIYEQLSFLVDRHWSEITKFWIQACETFNFESDRSIEKNILLIDFHLKSLNGLYSLVNSNYNSRFKKILDTKTEKRLSVTQLNNIINSTKKIYSRFLNLKKEIEVLPVLYAGSVEALRNSENEKTKNLKLQLRELESMIDSVRKLSDSASIHKKNGLTQEIESLQIKQDLFLSNLKQRQLLCYEQLAIINSKSGQQALAESMQKHEVFRDYLVQKDTNLKSSVSPGSARKELVDLRQTINKDVRLLSSFIKDFDSSISELSNVFAENKNNIEKIISELRNLSGKITTDLTQAEAILLKIQLAKNEAELRYEEAKKNLKAGNFTSARKNIELSRTRTNDALAFEENSEYRKMTDERLDKLGKEINDAENEVVVKDVREYLEKAKKDYFNTDFRKAEEVLSLARSRWAVTHIEPNEEVENWIGIVNTAGTLRTGRTISVSAPLYPQMIQLLNNANQLYLDSEQKIKSGKRGDALENLSQAKENIRQVLLMFPYNEIAGQLNLKIDKLIDPANFNEQFKRKVAAIKSGYKRNSQKSYSDLLDLYSIDKNFPGLFDLKNEIEIYLGLKLTPPNVKALSESANLTKSAQVIYNSGDKLSYPVAVQQLDAAIKLDPQNIIALRLKDTIQMSMGGASVVVLSASDEAKYQQAVLELQKGNKIIAAALVEQLMQSPNAKNSAKVRELKKRIDALL